MDALIRIYVEQVKDGRKTLDDVPEKYRDKVKAAIDNQQK